MDVPVNRIADTKKPHAAITWSLIAVMLFVRIGILGVGGIFTKANWLITGYEVGTYLLTAIFLWWEIKSLKDYHVDTLALFIIIVFKPVQTLILPLGSFNNALAFPQFPALLVWAIALALAAACWYRRKDLPRFEWTSLGWFGIGILAGVILGVLLAFPMSLQVEQSLSRSQFWEIVKQQGLIMIMYQIGFAGVSEEPLFRGFLWGALRKAGWRDLWIWLFQAGLFMAAHVYYVKQVPISFFVIVPVGALALGLLAWKTRSISSSLAMHGTVNALGSLWGALVRYFIR